MINEMSDQEKSVLLLRVVTPPNNVFDNTLNLYDPANMALAWRVLNWAMHQGPEETPAVPGLTIYSWSPKIYSYLRQSHWVDGNKLFLYSMPPADAQRLFLDKILELAIEVGLVPSTSSGQDEVEDPTPKTLSLDEVNDMLIGKAPDERGPERK